MIADSSLAVEDNADRLEWACVADSARYRHCIEERREAKRWFGSGAMPEKSGRHSRPAAGGGHSTVTNTGLE